MSAAKPALVVHALRYGLAVCGFTTQQPKDWPADHRWVHTQIRDEITCRDCRQVLGLPLTPGQVVAAAKEPVKKEPAPGPKSDPYSDRSA